MVGSFAVGGIDRGENGKKEGRNGCIRSWISLGLCGGFQGGQWFQTARFVLCMIAAAAAAAFSSPLNYDIFFFEKNYPPSKESSR